MKVLVVEFDGWGQGVVDGIRASVCKECSGGWCPGPGEVQSARTCMCHQSPWGSTFCIMPLFPLVVTCLQPGYPRAERGMIARVVAVWSTAGYGHPAA